MEYRFSDRVSSLKPSAIREIFKYAADPSVVSLSAGNPSPDAFPVKEIAEISAKVFAEDPISVLQYSVSEGYTPLRKHLTEYMKKEHNTGSDNDDILITTGAQQIMDLCSKALVNEGDVVICEAPSFIGSLNTFRSYNAKLAGDKVDIRLLLSPGSDPHSYEPKPSDITAIENCDIFICNGGESDEWVDGVLSSIENKDVKVMKMMETPSSQSVYKTSSSLSNNS